MTDGIWDAQQAIYTILTSHSPTMAGGRVHDHPPQDVEFPWVRIGNVIADEIDADQSSGTDETVTIDVYSRYGGKKEILEIMEEIKDSLHKAELSFGGRSAIAWWAGSLTMLDGDGETQHGVIRIRLISRI